MNTATRAQIRNLLSDYTDRIVALTMEAPAAADSHSNMRARILRALDALGGKRGPGRPPGSGTSKPAAKAAPKRRAIAMTPARAKALKLQGAYMGALRGLNAGDVAKVKAARAKGGSPA